MRWTLERRLVEASQFKLQQTNAEISDRNERMINWVGGYEVKGRKERKGIRLDGYDSGGLER